MNGSSSSNRVQRRLAYTTISIQPRTHVRNNQSRPLNLYYLWDNSPTLLVRNTSGSARTTRRIRRSITGRYESSITSHRSLRTQYLSHYCHCYARSRTLILTRSYALYKHGSNPLPLRNRSSFSISSASLRSLQLPRTLKSGLHNGKSVYSKHALSAYLISKAPEE